MNEPSVLDYVKSKLGMGEKIEFPANDITAPEEKKGVGKKKKKPELQPLETSSSPTPKDNDIKEKVLKKFPLLVLLALLLAIIGQRAFEPSPNRSSSTGLAFYFVAFLLLAWAYYRDEWRLPPLRKSETSSYTLAFKKIAFLLAIPFAIAAFATFGGNSFNLLNTFPWLLSLILFIWSFWQPEFSFKERIAQIKTFFEQGNWHIVISRWTLLVLAVFGIVLFFRLSQTGSVPPEPFSDHAEKIIDVYDISQGHTRIFFPRNTGREALQMYWTLLVASVFGTRLSFFSLKLGTALLGLLTLPYVYLLGKEVANKRVGLIAAFLMGISYWHNIISRVGLRFPLYPLFVAPVLFYLLRGIRRRRRNDFILAGIFLGLGMHGYSPFRIMPLVILVAIGIYLLHKASRGVRKDLLVQLAILILISLVIFLPLGRYALENPYIFSLRTSSRLGYFEEDTVQIFLTNFWDGVKMFNWNNGSIWVHSVGGRPALGVVSAVFFLFGVVFLLVRYLRKRNWLDLFLVLSIFLLSLPSTLSVAFPDENPALNRAGGAAVVVFIVAALAFDGLLASLKLRASRRIGTVSAWAVTILLLAISIPQNYDLVFNEYTENFRLSAWNSSEMGEVIQQFEQTYGQTQSVWIVPYKHWVDTRLPGVWAGIPNRDFALWQDALERSLFYEGYPKLFMVNLKDEETIEILQTLYPDGVLSRYTSAVEHHDFMIFRVP